MGSRFYDETLRANFVYDDTLGLWLPHSQPIFAPATAANGYIFDDFRDGTLSSYWTVDRGTDTTAAVNFARSAHSEIQGTTGNDGTGFAADGIYLRTPLWGLLSVRACSFRAKLKISDTAAVAFFAGLTATSTLQEPMSLSGTTFTTTAVDAAGFLFDTAATTDTIRCMGVAGNTDAASPIDTAIAAANDTYYELRIDFDVAGNGTFYVNGTSYGTLAVATRPSVNLYGVISVVTRNANTRIATVDYCGVV